MPVIHGNGDIDATGLRAAIVVAMYLWRDYRKFTDAPLAIASADATVDIARGANYRAIVDQLRRFRDAGCTEMVLVPADQGAAYPAQARIIASEVLPKIRGWT